MATAQELIAHAVAEKGYTEDNGTNRTKFAALAGHANGYAWCATYVVAMMRSVGIKLPSESASTLVMYQGFVKAGASVRPADLQPGDVILFDFVAPFNTNGIQHVGIFIKWLAPGVAQTIEGNTSSGEAGSQDHGGGVFLRERPVRYIVGAGRPAYSSAPVAPVPPAPTEKVMPDFNPPVHFPDVVSALGAPGGGVWLLGIHGEIYAFNCADHDGPNRHPEYWTANHQASKLIPSPNGLGYTVVDIDGNHYDYNG